MSTDTDYIFLLWLMYCARVFKGINGVLERDVYLTVYLFSSLL